MVSANDRATRLELIEKHKTWTALEPAGTDSSLPARV